MKLIPNQKKNVIKRIDKNVVATKINWKYSISYLNAFLCSRTNYSSDRSFFIKREQHTGLYILDYDVPTLNVTIIYKRRIAWYIYSIAATSRLNNFCGIQGEQIKSEEGNIWCICLNRLMIYSPRKKLYVIRDIYQYCLLE